jgi:hypothetical protein
MNSIKTHVLIVGGIVFEPSLHGLGLSTSDGAS